MAGIIVRRAKYIIGIATLIFAVVTTTQPAAAVVLTPAFVQNNAAITNGTGLTTVASAFPDDNTAGNLIVVYVEWEGNLTPPVVTDTNGNSYVAAAAPVTLGSNGQQIFYAKNVAAGANTITATFSGTTSFRVAYIHEYSGIDKDSPLDQWNGKADGGSTMNSGNVTTTFSTELLFSGGGSDGGGSTAGPGYTQRSTFSGDITQDRVVSSIGTYDATATHAGSVYGIQLATFKAARVAPTAPVAAPVLATSSDTGDSNSDGVTTETMPTFTGSCVDGQVVSMYANGTALLPTQVCTGGAYAITLTEPLALGMHTITSSFGDSDGTSAQGSAVEITIYQVAASPTDESSSPSVPLAPNTGIQSSVGISVVWLILGGLVILSTVALLKRYH